MSLQALEDSVVAILQVVFDDYETVTVAPLAQMKAEFEHVIDDPQVWVVLESIKGGEEESTQALRQGCTYRFGFVIKARLLRGDLGVYNLIDLVNAAALGKRPQDGSGWLKLISWTTVSEENGTWRAIGVMECPGLPLFEQYDLNADDGAPLEVLTHTEE